MPIGDLTGTTLTALITTCSENFSEIRRLKSLFWEYQDRLGKLAEISSSKDEMRQDWQKASLFIASKLLNGEGIDFIQLENASYQLLEDIWLNDIKVLTAYHLWLNTGNTNVEDNYYEACAGIRNLLIRKERAPRENVEYIAEYIRKTYLINDKLDDRNSMRAKMLISRKAERIHITTGNDDREVNWFRAKLYSELFYENIVPAILDDDDIAMSNVLKAFEFNKSPNNQYLVLNAFEAAIALNCLNKERLRSLLGDYKFYDFSMVQVSDWPATEEIVFSPKSRFRYDENNKQIIFEGVMTEDEFSQLTKLFPEKEQAIAIDKLYAESQLKPYPEMIL